MSGKVYYVGSEQEVAHHARPLSDRFDVEIIDPRRVTEVAGPNDLAIFFSEHFERFRTAITRLRDRGCRTLYCIDGILEWRNAFENRPTEPACPWTMRPVLCDKVAAIGRSQARLLDYWGNGNRIELIGLPRFDSLASQLPQQPDRNPGPDPAEEKNNKSETSERTLLVMTAKWPAFTEQQQENLERSLIDLRDWLATRPEIRTIWRLTQGLEEKLGIENRFGSFTGTELIEQIRQCDAVITTPSTAMLESMLLGRPTAILEYNDSPQLNETAWQIRHALQIEPVVRELLSPPPVRMAQQHFALHDTLECHSPALPRLCRLIEVMLQAPAGSLTDRMIPIESVDRVSTFGNEFLFAGYRLQNATDELQWKTQVAFLEREVDRLRERNELLEREFNRAKTTIDRLFSNPVVSPFIKAGEIARGVFSTKPRDRKTDSN